MANGDLYDFASVTLNGSGNGTAKVGPLTAREVWSPTNASVKTNQTVITNEAQCALYSGPSATQPNFKDLTFTGSSGDASDKIAGRLKVGNYIWAVWSGGDAGAIATLSVTGTKEI
jgi:hypothetical protein